MNTPLNRSRVTIIQALTVAILLEVLASPAASSPTKNPAAVTTLAVRVHHMEAMEEFYSSAFGIRFETVETGGISSRFGRLGAIQWKFVPIRQSTDFEGYRVFQPGFEVENLEAVLATAQELGGLVLDPPRRDGASLVASVRDPDGNTIELSQPLGGLGWDELYGTWEGSGTLMGAPARFRWHWEPALAGRFVSLTYETVRETHEGEKLFDAVSMVELAGPPFRGSWFDSWGQEAELSGRFENRLLTVDWTSGGTVGRTTHSLSEADTLIVTDRAWTEEGWEVFGEAIGRRVPAGGQAAEEVVGDQ